MKNKYNKITIIKWFVLSATIGFIAILPHLRSTLNNLSFDEAEYALAARKGLILNAMDLEGTREQRHFHGPLMIYFIKLSAAIFGESEWAVQLPSRIFGILTVIVLFYGCVLVFRNGEWIGLISSISLAIMPTFVQVCGVANMHAVTAFLITVSLFVMIKLVQENRVLYLYVQAIFLGLLFTTFEYGFILFGIVILVLLFTKNSILSIFGGFSFSKHLVGAAALCFLTILIIWPAGIIQLNIFRNLLYYIQYSEHGHPILFRGELLQQVPWWAYIYWFWDIAPVWTILSVTGFILFAGHVVFSRYDTKMRVIAIFILVLLAVLFKQHIMSARYAIFVIPFFCLFIALLLDFILKKSFIIGLIFVVLAIVSQFSFNYKKLVTFSQGDPGYKQAAQYLRENSPLDVKILAWYKPILNFYLPGIKDITNYNTGYASLELMEHIQNGYYDYILIYHNQVQRWPDDPGYKFVKENFNLVFTFSNLEKTYLWLYQRPETL